MAIHKIILLVTLVSGQCHSQIQDSLTAPYPFIETTYNCLQYPASTATLDRLFHKIDQIQQGDYHQIQWLHIGGSHVQGGSFSASIREGLSMLLPIHRPAAHGFIFPFPLAQTNSPGFLDIHFTGDWKDTRGVRYPKEGPFGLSAIKTETKDPFSSVHMSVRKKGKGFFSFTTVRIYYDIYQSTMIPEPFSFECPESIIIDPENGYIEWTYATPQTDLEMVLLPLEPEATPLFIFHGVQFLDDTPAIMYHMAASNGASLRTFLNCELLPKHLDAIKPDIVLLGIGVNDANAPNGQFNEKRFQMHYDSLIGHLKRANPDVALIFITNNDTWYKKKKVNENVFEAVEAMYLLAEKHDAAVWDQFAIMGGLNAITTWQKAGLAKSDRIHFTPKGYTLMGQLFAHAFGDAFWEFCQPQPNTPE